MERDSIKKAAEKKTDYPSSPIFAVADRIIKVYMKNSLLRHNYNTVHERLAYLAMNASYPVSYNRMVVETGNQAEFDKNESTKNTVPMISEAAYEILLAPFIIVQLYDVEINRSPCE